MTKVLFFLISVSLFSSLNTNKMSNNILLQTAINTDVFSKEFSLCTNKNDLIFLFDKVSFLSFDTSYQICGKTIKIIHQTPQNMTSSSLVILHRVVKNSSNCTLYFWKPYSGAVVNLKFKYKGRKKAILFDTEIGSI